MLQSAWNYIFAPRTQSSPGSASKKPTRTLLECDFCDKTYAWWEDLDMHINSKHSEEKADRTQREIYEFMEEAARKQRMKEAAAKEESVKEAVVKEEHDQHTTQNRVQQNIDATVRETEKLEAMKMGMSKEMDEQMEKFDRLVKKAERDHIRREMESLQREKDQIDFLMRFHANAATALQSRLGKINEERRRLEERKRSMDQV
ncbi:hypothetical protein HII31_04457 [Pseudocercospora fuligena]|uniref:C2H2-type domain-containing protein n=1 Tax=Pseudocercospora fuligena TaxID=685502 RepID=A0A8H6RLU4_9PEZI|nr:hypothetical protein HII31_04457 [Pseudocercospora fuligena]